MFCRLQTRTGIPAHPGCLCSHSGTRHGCACASTHCPEILGLLGLHPAASGCLCRHVQAAHAPSQPPGRSRHAAPARGSLTLFSWTLGQLRGLGDPSGTRGPGPSECPSPRENHTLVHVNPASFPPPTPTQSSALFNVDLFWERHRALGGEEGEEAQRGGERIPSRLHSQRRARCRGSTPPEPQNRGLSRDQESTLTGRAPPGSPSALSLPGRGTSLWVTRLPSGPASGKVPPTGARRAHPAPHPPRLSRHAR